MCCGTKSQVIKSVIYATNKEADPEPPVEEETIVEPEDEEE
jgi:hypothetical protein